MDSIDCSCPVSLYKTNHQLMHLPGAAPPLLCLLLYSAQCAPTTHGRSTPLPSQVLSRFLFSLMQPGDPGPFPSPESGVRDRLRRRIFVSLISTPVPSHRGPSPPDPGYNRIAAVGLPVLYGPGVLCSVKYIHSRLGDIAPSGSNSRISIQQNGSSAIGNAQSKEEIRSPGTPYM
ncbi:hypothetical protein BDV19DRAFT_48108 [Aspergillus venezuelensis]